MRFLKCGGNCLSAAFLFDSYLFNWFFTGHGGQRVLWKFASFVVRVRRPGTNRVLTCHNSICVFLDVIRPLWSFTSIMRALLSVQKRMEGVWLLLWREKSRKKKKLRDERQFPQKRAERPISRGTFTSGSLCPRSAHVLVALDNSELPLKVDLVIWHGHSQTGVTSAWQWIQTPSESELLWKSPYFYILILSPIVF